MKKLNTKGFTLVELLAVIVILAIVVGITLVTVLPTLKNSRQQAFELSAQIAADFIEKQYQLSLIGQNTTITTFGTKKADGTYTPVRFDKTTITAAGLKAGNYANHNDTHYYINEETGRACVQLRAVTTINLKNTPSLVNLNGEHKVGEYHDISGYACSIGCPDTITNCNKSKVTSGT